MTHYHDTVKMFQEAGIPFTQQDVVNRHWITVHTSRFAGAAPGRGETIKFVFNIDGTLEEMFVDDPNSEEI